MNRQFELFENQCGCPDRDRTFPQMLSTYGAPAPGAEMVRTVLHPTRDGEWSPCPQLNGGEDWERKLLWTTASKEELQAAAEEAAVEANASGASFWRRQLVAQLQKDVDSKHDTLRYAKERHESAALAAGRSECRLALAAADLPADVAEAAWVLVKGWHGSPTELIEAARGLVEQ